nr:hypothetical protein [Gammaproteobacteria bacterium]
MFWKDRQSVYRGCNRRFATHADLQTPAAVLSKAGGNLACTKPQTDFYRPVDRTVMASGAIRWHVEAPQHRADDPSALLLTCVYRCFIVSS